MGVVLGEAEGSVPGAEHDRRAARDDVHVPVVIEIGDPYGEGLPRIVADLLSEQPAPLPQEHRDLLERVAASFPAWAQADDAREGMTRDQVQLPVSIQVTD